MLTCLWFCWGSCLWRLATKTVAEPMLLQSFSKSSRPSKYFCLHLCCSLKEFNFLSSRWANGFAKHYRNATAGQAPSINWSKGQKHSDRVRKTDKMGHINFMNSIFCLFLKYYLRYPSIVYRLIDTALIGNVCQLSLLISKLKFKSNVLCRWRYEAKG